ncbi:uncharacterized protein LOC116416922 [Nasonia vitripennis]|uniref:Integrase catalytic domain-containing protein n=1 Tax=Nasonia vitripennis TaxID=7425 RepID=A0A7M7QA36_NASVI|nr:uncharacterized protein LOC116416922 [Nasonia vitripennis]
MGNLPRKRVQRYRPFLHSGVDFAGPINLRLSKGRGTKSFKGYICVFVCLSTRAVHLEAVSGYSSNEFLAAYKRFSARRGICASLTSDCGLNFVGASKELKILFQRASTHWREIANLLANDGTEWRFNPPGAPHFGGIWEAAVKSTKFHLKRVIGETPLTFEEMTTLLALIEATLNSRPLQAITDDPEDLAALTPGHFLIGEPLVTIPEPSTLDLSASRLSRWQMLRNMHEHFWSRWSEEYLHTLQQRSKWRTEKTQIRVGELCLLRNEQYPPCKWPLGRIVKVYPGPDGLVRVVDVKTATSCYNRPISKISVLPLEDDDSPVTGEGGRDVPKPN